jgi:hypothetical protein
MRLTEAWETTNEKQPEVKTLITLSFNYVHENSKSSADPLIVLMAQKTPKPPILPRALDRAEPNMRRTFKKRTLI